MSCQCQCPVTVTAPAKSGVSWPHPWAGGPMGKRTRHPGQPRKGCEYYTVERLLATLTHSKTFQAVCRLWGRGAAGPLCSGWIWHVPEVDGGENAPGAVLGQQSTLRSKHTPQSHGIDLSQGWYDLALATNVEARRRGLRDDLLLSGSISGPPPSSG